MQITLNAPQIVWIVLVVYALIINIIKHGESRDYNAFSCVFDILVTIAILKWGGFF